VGFNKAVPLWEAGRKRSASKNYAPIQTTYYPRSNLRHTRAHLCSIRCSSCLV